jgi:hypothetical protein
MKQRLILIGFLVLIIFGIAYFYPSNQNKRKKKIKSMEFHEANFPPAFKNMWDTLKFKNNDFLKDETVFGRKKNEN